MALLLWVLSIFILYWNCTHVFSNGDWGYPSHSTWVCSTYMMQQQLNNSSNNRQWIFFSGPNSLAILLQVAGILQSWPWHLCRSRVALKSWLCSVVSTDLILHLVSCFIFILMVPWLLNSYSTLTDLLPLYGGLNSAVAEDVLQAIELKNGVLLQGWVTMFVASSTFIFALLQK
jgi:hypothetical protein